MLKPYHLAAIRPDPDSAGQYCEADCLELEGRSFRLSMDNGKTVAATFPGSGLLCLATLGGDVRMAACRCLKLADGTYFLFPGDDTFPANRRLYAALDLQASQITVVDADAGFSPRFGTVTALSKAAFGARHAVSGDLHGTRIVWQFGSRCAVSHRYTADGRLYAAPAVPWEPAAKTDAEAAKAAFVVKLREDIYLTAALMHTDAPLPALQLLLADLNAIRCVGCFQFGGASAHTAVSGCGAFLPPAPSTQQEAIR